MLKKENWLLNVEKLVLFYQFQQKWDCIASSKGLNYYLFTKNIFEPRNYINPSVAMNNTTLLRYRTSDLKLPIETSRRDNIPRNKDFVSLIQKKR